MSTAAKTGAIALLTDVTTGGAGRAAADLFQGLRTRGDEVELWQVIGKAAQRAVLLDREERFSGFERLLKNVAPQLARRLRHGRQTRLLRAAVHARRPKLLHVHGLHACGLNHDSLRSLPTSLPILWTLHDQWPLNPHPFIYEDRGAEIRLGTDEVDMARAEARRQAFFGRGNIAFAAPSRWLVRVARAVLPERVPVHQVELGVPFESFAAVDPAEARRELGLEEKVFWVGFSSAGSDRRKGLDVVTEALARLPADTKVGLLSWGSVVPEVPAPNVRVRHLGYIREPGRLHKAYGACSVFLCPSRADNQPLAIIEALRAGTPVIGSDRGGVPELVTGVHGEVVSAEDNEAWSRAIQAWANEPWEAVARRRAEARAIAVRRFRLERQARDYAALYEAQTRHEA